MMCNFEKNRHTIDIAHIRENLNGPYAQQEVQTVSDHCRNVAALCSSSLASVGLKNTGYLAGLLHDMGKCTDVFNRYIFAAAAGEPVKRGSVNHSFAAVKYLFSHYSNNPSGRLACEVLGWAIGSHHGQYDCINLDGLSGFSRRIEKEGIFYEEALRNYLQHVASEQELDTLFGESEKEIIQCMGMLIELSQSITTKDATKVTTVSLFELSALCRLVLSALIDADREDTAIFMGYRKYAKFRKVDKVDWREYSDAVNNNVRTFPQLKTVDKARCEFSKQCASFPYEKGRVYRLWLPTGGGKTISSLRAALAVAERTEAVRIFFVIPLLSVLDQNAQVIRKFLADDSIILEHHSNVLLEGLGKEELGRNEVLSQTWQSPVVITTLVQLLDTMFKGKGSCIRRMNALANSVLVIDEVQSIPREHLSCFNLMVDFLVGFCNTTVILCSATQPCFEEVDYPMFQPEDIVEHSGELWAPFERTVAVNIDKPFDFDELAEFVKKNQCEYGSVLLICNTKSQSKKMYQILAEDCEYVIHLSTGMCMAHRIENLKKATAHLEAREPVICVSTQLVEAGVDLSFGCAVRLLAGVDNIAQAAGRCNRNGESPEKRPVFIVKLKNEKLRFLKEIREAQNATENVLAAFEDPFSAEAEKAYYTTLFSGMKEGALDGPYTIGSRSVSILDLLSCNNQSFSEASVEVQKNQSLRQAAKTAGELFEVFDSNTFDVLVPYGEGEVLIADLLSERAKRDVGYRGELAEKSKQFTISLFAYQKERMGGDAFKIVGDNDALALLPAYYSSEFGLDEFGEQDSIITF